MAKKKNIVEVGISTKQAQQVFERIYTDFISGCDSEQILEYINTELGEIELEKFSDYATWVPMRPIIALKSYLSDEDAVQVACRGRIAAVTNSGYDEQIEAFQMMLEGEISGIDLLAMAKNTGDTEWERSLYLKIIAQFITIVEMGASRKFGYPEAVKALEAHLKEARKRLF